MLYFFQPELFKHAVHRRDHGAVNSASLTLKVKP